MIRLAVTGNAGFIGKNLVQILNNKNYEVFNIDISDGFDLTDHKCIESLPYVDIIIHLAAYSFVPLSFKTPEVFYRNNYLSTLNVLEKARKSKARVIFFSSYLYGNPHYLPIDENHPLAPHNPYAQSKIICEKLCEGYHRDFGLPIIIFRPFNIYGPGQNKSFLIPKILEQLKTGDVHLEDSRPRRDFIHVMDIIGAVIKAIESGITGYEVFNLGSGKSISIRKLADEIVLLAESHHKVFFSNIERKGEVLDSVADIRKAKALLSWEPLINLKDGLRSIIKER